MSMASTAMGGRTVQKCLFDPRADRGRVDPQAGSVLGPPLVELLVLPRLEKLHSQDGQRDRQGWRAKQAATSALGPPGQQASQHVGGRAETLALANREGHAHRGGGDRVQRDAAPEVLAELEGVIARARERETLDDRTTDEILGYDDDGLPS